MFDFFDIRHLTFRKVQLENKFNELIEGNRINNEPKIEFDELVNDLIYCFDNAMQYLDPYYYKFPQDECDDRTDSKADNIWKKKEKLIKALNNLINRIIIKQPNAVEEKRKIIDSFKNNYTKIEQLFLIEDSERTHIYFSSNRGDKITLEEVYCGTYDQQFYKKTMGHAPLYLKDILGIHSKNISDKEKFYRINFENYTMLNYFFYKQKYILHNNLFNGYPEYNQRLYQYINLEFGEEIKIESETNDNADNSEWYLKKFRKNLFKRILKKMEYMKTNIFEAWFGRYFGDRVDKITSHITNLNFNKVFVTELQELVSLNKIYVKNDNRNQLARSGDKKKHEKTTKESKKSAKYKWGDRSKKCKKMIIDAMNDLETDPEEWREKFKSEFGASNYSAYIRVFLNRYQDDYFMDKKGNPKGGMRFWKSRRGRKKNLEKN